MTPNSTIPQLPGFLLLLLSLLLSSCVDHETIRPAFVIEDAHSSGSRVTVDASRPLAASGGLEGTLSLWDLSTGKRLANWKGHAGTVHGLALFAEGKRLVSGSWDGTLAFWDLQGRLVRRVDAGAPVTAMAASRDLSTIWTGHGDGSLRRWNGQGKLLQERRLPLAERITALALSGDRLAVADHDGGVWLFANSVEEAPRRLASLPAYLRNLVFRPDGSRLFGGSWFHLYRWETGSGEMTRLETPHRGIIADLAWSPSGGELMSISRQTDSAVLALDPETGTSRRDFGKHDLCGASIAVSRNGRYLVTTSDDASVRIWHLDSSERRNRR